MAATPEDVAILLEMIGTTDKTEADLMVLLDRLQNADGSLNFNATAANIWNQKAAAYAGLVDVSESGSSRKFSDLYKNALAMAKKYEDEDTTVVVDTASRPKVNSIVRL